MGLGGLTRDSIIGLNNLVAHDEEFHENDLASGGGGDHRRGASHDGDEFLFLDGDAALTPTASTGSFETSLNDGVTATSAAVATPPAPSPPTQARRNVSATNSRSLDSYRSEATGNDGARAAHYQGFQYEGYTEYADYYAQDFAAYDAPSVADGSRGRPKENVFCCMFAPWRQTGSIASEDPSSLSSPEVEQQPPPSQQRATSSPPGAASDVESSAAPPENITASPTSSQTPAPKEEVPPGLADEPSPKSIVLDALTLDADPVPPSSAPAVATEPPPDVTSLPTPPDNLPCVQFAAPRSTETLATEHPSAPHLLSDGLSEASTSPDFSCFDDENNPEEGVPGSGTSPASPNDEDEDEDEDEPPPLVSILKVSRCSMASIDSHASRHGKKKSAKPSEQAAAAAAATATPAVRHLFPVYEPKKTHVEAEARTINFNPMARVLTISSRKDLAPYDRAQIWWQRRDYDEFKKTGRVISKAMECGGSEIWLASSNAWGQRAARGRPGQKKDEDPPLEADAYKQALSKYVAKEAKGGAEDDFGEKWWCKFGHSRRGLEHIASPAEGRARQQSVLLAIRKVMEEQRRQRTGRTKDPNKLRNLAMQYTSWARELSLAAGEADAEAVASDFHPTAACRAQHFARYTARWARTPAHQADAVGRGVAVAVTSHILDAHTHAPTPRAPKAKGKAKPKRANDGAWGDRAKGYMPGGQGEGFAEMGTGFRPQPARISST